MGPSPVSTKSQLAAPLLDGRPPAHAPANTASADWTPSCPSSFKAGKPRKTRDFIGSEKSNTRSAQEAQPSVDPRLLNDTDAEIFTKVATLVYGHIQEGLKACGAMARPLDDQFHEAHFLRRRWCHWQCCRRRARKQGVSSEEIQTFINDFATSLFFCKQVIVLGAVYIERFLSTRPSYTGEPRPMLTEHNWRTVVVVAILVASKVWEDVHPWNADFEECLKDVAGISYARGALYRMETMFVEKLEWKVFVSGEDYAAYFFALLENRKQPLVTPIVKERTHSESFAGSRKSFAIEPIFEDEMFVPGCESQKRRCKSAVPPQSPLSHRNSTPLPFALPLATTPWDRKDLLATWKQGILGGGDAGALTTCAMNDVWKLDAANPYIGALRHAPPAPPPSKHIRQSEGGLWVQALATRTCDVLSAHKSRQDTSTTLSGATGAQMAAELKRILTSKGGAVPATATTTKGGPLAPLFGAGTGRGGISTPSPTTTLDLFGAPVPSPTAALDLFSGGEP